MIATARKPAAILATGLILISLIGSSRVDADPPQEGEATTSTVTPSEAERALIADWFQLREVGITLLPQTLFVDRLGVTQEQLLGLFNDEEGLFTFTESTPMERLAFDEAVGSQAYAPLETRTIAVYTGASGSGCDGVCEDTVGIEFTLYGSLIIAVNVMVHRTT